MKFSDLDLHPSVMQGVTASQFTECTPIQEVAIPHILNGRDVAGLAQTGTGKTAAFVLPLLDRVMRAKDYATQFSSKIDNTLSGAETPVSDNSVDNQTKTERFFPKWKQNSFILILVPTRELAEQVHENIKKFGQFTGVHTAVVYGGTGYEAQTQAFRKGVEFVVATPGRLIDLYKENIVDLNQVQAIVFDEADRMFDMGFKDDMRYILRRVPRDRQFLVFSATLNFDVLQVAYESGSNPIEVNVSRDQAKAENVEDEIFHVGQEEKGKYLISIIRKNESKQTIVFSNFKHNVERIAKFLSMNGLPAMGISSLLSQGQRNRVMELFRSENDKNILIATDVAARGLDVKGVDLVVNFELPDDAENYVHRIGRTGRAGEAGKAKSLVSDRDVEALQRIETYLGHKISIGWLDDNDIVKEYKPFPKDDRRERHFDHPNKHRGDRRPPQKHVQGRFERKQDQKPSEDRHAKHGKRPFRDKPPQHKHGHRSQYGKPHHDKQHQDKQYQGKRPHDKREQRPPRSYTHRPQQTNKPTPPLGLAEKISGFFRKLFS